MKMIEHQLDELTTQAPTQTQLRATSFNPKTLQTTQNCFFDTKKSSLITISRHFLDLTLTPKRDGSGPKSLCIMSKTILKQSYEPVL